MENLQKFIKDAHNDNVSVSSLLRQAKTLVCELDKTDVPLWITLEFGGYKKNDKTPDYRQIRGQMKGWNPYYGWVPVVHNSTETEDKLCIRGTRQSIREIEELLTDKSSSYEMPYSATLADKILDGNFKTKVSLFISRSSLVSILETVRSNLIDWAINMKKDKKDFDEDKGRIKKEVGGMRLPGGVAIGPLMFSKDGKTANAIMGPAIIPFDYGITNCLNSLNKTSLSADEFQVAFNSQVEALVGEMLNYFQSRLKPITQTNIGQFNSIDKCVKEYAKHSIDFGEICNIEFLLAVDSVRGRKHHSNRRYDFDYVINEVTYDTVEKLRELNRLVHKEIHSINDSLASTHKDYDVKVTQTDTSTTIEFIATSHAFDLTKGGKVVPKKPKDNETK